MTLAMDLFPMTTLLTTTLLSFFLIVSAVLDCSSHFVQAAEVKRPTFLRRLSPAVDLHEQASSEHQYDLDVTSDGPVVRGATGTFVAVLRASNLGEQSTAPTSFCYTWTGPPNYLNVKCGKSDTTTVQIEFEPKVYEAGLYTFHVKVYPELPLHLLAEGNATIAITDTMNGEVLAASRAYPQCNTTGDSQCNLPTGANVSLIASVYDPSDYLESAEFLYTWDTGDGQVYFEASPVLEYSYEKMGVYNVTCNTTAVTPSSKIFNGSWTKSITVLDAITNLTIKSSSPSVKVGNREVVNITCNGSPPINLCLTVLEPTDQHINETNTTCGIVEGESCYSSIVYHFKTSGMYRFIVAATNNVSFAGNVSAIQAHTPSLPPQSITAITIAVVAGLLMTVIGVMAFLQQVQRNRLKHIEVANFDFQMSESDMEDDNPVLRFLGIRKNSREKKPIMNRSSKFYGL
ncbi:transmembrane protein 130-like [Diadema antillarum]|uniref:transmembrane protein 130-like n=1 Tax=Diadema antillarum TaxID=105358 RepID=UPI003A84AFE1